MQKCLNPSRNEPKTCKSLFTAIVLATVAWTPGLNAQTLAYDLPRDASGNIQTVPPAGVGGIVVGFDDPESVTTGFSFTVNDTDVLIYSLGFFDSGRDGLTQDHAIGIWNQSGALIAFATAGASSSLIGDYRYSDLVAPLLLSSGSYVIAALSPSGNSDDGYQPFRGVPEATSP